MFTESIYVIHALRGYEYHQRRIEKLFKEQNLSFEFVTDGDPSLFSSDLLEKYFVADIQSKLSKGVLSCTLNHILAYKKMVERQQKYAIVFENDPYFLGNFTEDLKKIQPEIENLEKGFIISLENSTLRFPSYWQEKSEKHLYQAKTGRMAGAYLIDLCAAERILADLETNKCHDVIDWWHNGLIERGITKMYWAFPALVEQGSHNGKLNSTISSKPKGIIRRMKWMAQKNYKTHLKRFINEKRLIEG